jgi:cob(I)alamin adenosyltransferase
LPDKKLRIYTRTGDLGETSLVGGKRTAKDSLRVSAYGSIDELNAFIGLCVVKMAEIDLKNHLLRIQNDLHVIGANLAYPGNLTQAAIGGESIAARIPRITEESISCLESWIDQYDEELPPLRNFILCGGTEESALLHVARTVCRRAERVLVELKRTEEIDRNIIRYSNRLSDYLMTAARLATKRAGKEDIKWSPSITTLDAFIGEKK